MIRITAKRACRYKDKLDINLERLTALSASSREVLIEANGLRNHLVHRYNRRDDLLAMQSMLDLQNGIMTFGDEVETWLVKMSSQQ